MNYHPDVRLRTQHVQVHLNYDGSVTLETFCEVIGRDGQSMEHRVGYGHRLAPNEWHGTTLPQAIAAAVKAHHEALGLNPPDEELPLHLHPHGYPGTEHYAPVPEAPRPQTPPDHEERVAQYVRTAKAQEMGLAPGEMQERTP